VTFTGSVPDVRPYLSAAALAVAPLRMGSGTRLKVLETMAMARAMVSTTIGCEGLHVVDGKHLLVADDAETFAERALELLDNPEASRAIGCRGRKLVESQYGWDTIVERLDRFQGELVAEILA
jgi:glycosyltransferase involved in cell wall biosynthesis